MEVRTFRRIVALSRFHRVAGTARDNFNLPVLSVFHGVCRNVTQAVLASKFFCNLIENSLKTVFAGKGERCTARLVGKLPECSDVSAPAENHAASAPAVRPGN